MDTTIRRLDRNDWSDSASGFLDYNYRHVWEFDTACADRVGAQSEHVALVQAGATLGLADLRIKRIPVLGTGIAYINGGPLVRRNDPHDVDRLRGCLGALVREYAQKQGLVLRVMGPVGPEAWIVSQRAAFAEAGFTLSHAANPYRTLLLDLNKPLDEIRKGLAQKWRNCLNHSERRDLVVRTGTSPDLLRTFCDLFAQFVGRKQFEVDLLPPFYLAVQEQLPERERFHIHLAQWEDRVVAGHVASFLGDTCVYLLGATSEEGLRTKAAYLLQWRVIQSAHEKGLKWYDLGGIDPEANPGVHHFKRGLGAQEITAPGPLEYPAAGWRRAAVHGSEQVYRWLRRAK
jgi:Acetyltransferase (GNAT) domain